MVTLPNTYPAESPPQIQLLSRYIGPYSVDAAIFGVVLRTFLSHASVEWTPGTVIVFEGLEAIQTHLSRWYGERKSADAAGQMRRDDEKDSKAAYSDVKPEASEHQGEAGTSLAVVVQLPLGIELFESEPIIDRKSAFVGRACAISDPSQVSLFITIASRKTDAVVGPSHPWLHDGRQANIKGSPSNNQRVAMYKWRYLASRQR